jgi:hypothetical protein
MWTGVALSNLIQFRRGTAAQLTTTTLAQGEPGWTTDSFELVVGDGSKVGGHPVVMSGRDATLSNLSVDGASFLDDVRTSSVRSSSSAGVVLKNQAGSTCLVLGAGGSQGATFSNGVNILSGTLTVTTADINGGAIDGTSIGATTASTGAFTTLNASTSIVIGADPGGTGLLRVGGDISLGPTGKIYNAGVASFLQLNDNVDGVELYSAGNLSITSTTTTSFSGTAFIIGTDPGGTDLLRVGGSATINGDLDGNGNDLLDWATITLSGKITGPSSSSGLTDLASVITFLQANFN